MAVNYQPYAWGAGTEGQLGTNSFGSPPANVAHSSPVLIVGSHSFVAVVGGGENSLGLKSNGEVWSWGKGQDGALGDNTATGKSSPVLVVGSHSFIRIMAGAQNTATGRYHGVCGAIKANGQVWMWGDNNIGQLGDLSITDRSSPVLVVGSHAFVSGEIGEGRDGSGGTHVVALKEDGTAWGWGYGFQGALGNGASDTHSSPVAVVGSHIFTKATAGPVDSAGLKSNGQVWTWGFNDHGQGGTNNTTAHQSPVLVVGSHSFVDVVVGDKSMLALKADGSAWAWGAGGSAELGDGAMTDRSSPVAVIGAHSFVRIFAGSAANGGIKADGSAWMWGTNSSGTVGDNTVTTRSSPVLVVGGFYWLQISSSGEGHTLGIGSPEAPSGGGGGSDDDPTEGIIYTIQRF